jgi:hypothetical protein
LPVSVAVFVFFGALAVVAFFGGITELPLLLTV